MKHRKKVVDILLLLPAMAFGSIFKESGFTKEHVEFYFELDSYFFSDLKKKKQLSKAFLKYYKQLKEAVIKYY